MANRRKKSSKCPEPFNTLIDLAAGLTMGAIADRMEEKYHYKKKGKINPYAVSAVGIASGRLKSAEGLLQTGAVLGAAGSFDVEADNKPYAADDPLFTQVHELKTQDNRYAWRLNCADGSAYGIDPQNYETRDAYHAALHSAKAAMQPDEDITDSSPAFSENATQSLPQVHPIAAAETYSVARTSDPFAGDDFHVYIYCRVQLSGSAKVLYYRTENASFKKGDTVLVPDPITKRIVAGTLLSVERHMRFSVPQPVEQTYEIIDYSE